MYKFYLLVGAHDKVTFRSSTSSSRKSVHLHCLRKPKLCARDKLGTKIAPFEGKIDRLKGLAGRKLSSVNGFLTTVLSYHVDSMHL